MKPISSLTRNPQCEKSMDVFLYTKLSESGKSVIKVHIDDIHRKKQVDQNQHYKSRLGCRTFVHV